MSKTLVLLCTAILAVPTFAKVALAPIDAQDSQSFESFKPKKAKFNAKKATFTNAKGTIINMELDGSEPENWFNLDPATDNVQGVSTEKTYTTFGEPDAANEIIVAVIDSGVDVNHEALQGNMWMNKGETGFDSNGMNKLNNGIDDDGNGYIDDVYGWNFIGGSKGMATFVEDTTLENGIRLEKGDTAAQVGADTLELTREVLRMRNLKAALQSAGENLTRRQASHMKKIEKEMGTERVNAQSSKDEYSSRKASFVTSSAVLTTAGVLTISMESVTAFTPTTEEQTAAKNVLLGFLSKGWSIDRFDNAINYFSEKLDYYYNVKFNPRTIVGDDYTNTEERIYGNNDVIGPDSSHGTHVSGIIAASRSGKFPVKGVASNVKIMAVRCVPNGDERDKDVANSIRYAVDNGARVINMSFGKSFSPYKKAVDSAIEYAASKGVLLVHAAGNSNQDNDTASNFPNRKLNKTEATNWLEIGASSFERGSKLAADFSNFGDKTVDFFAPGVDILSSTPDNNYDSYSGTSMASPAVAGVAALTLQYNPLLTMGQLKTILLQTVTRYPGEKIFKPGLGMLFFADLSKMGGVANVFEAVSVATQLKQDNSSLMSIFALAK